MPGIHETGSRLIHSGLSELKKQIKKVVNKFSGRSVKEHPPVQNLSKSSKGDMICKSLDDREVSNTGEPNSSIGAIRKTRAKDVLPEMIPGKVQPPPELKDAKIGEKLGSGQYGTVYTVDNAELRPESDLGESPQVLQKKYVVKDQTIDPEDSEKPEEVKEFKSHVKNEVNLQNFNGNSFPVVQDDFFTGKDGTLHHKAMMEYGGYPLDKVIDKKSFHSIGRQFLLQLSSLHQQGIIHGDIKADNVLVNHQGRVRLVDFGFAQKGDIVHPDDQVFNKIAGAPAFMAPEVYQGHTYSLKADIWTAGVMFYESLRSKDFPWLYEDPEKEKDYGVGIDGSFHEEEYNKLISSIKEAPDLSEDEKSLLLSMLALNPSERPTAEALLRTPFFQNQEGSDEGYFDLQNQHQLQYQRLALLEKEIEETEALNKDDDNAELAEKIVDLTSEVSLVGTELKCLQSKMELLDMKAEQKSIESTLQKAEADPDSYMKQVVNVWEKELANPKKELVMLEKELAKLEKELNREEKNIVSQKTTLQQTRDNLNANPKPNKTRRRKIKAEIINEENKMRTIEAKRDSLEKRIDIKKTQIDNKKTQIDVKKTQIDFKKTQMSHEYIKKEVEDLKTRAYFSGRDIKLKQIQIKELGSKADFLRTEKKLDHAVMQANTSDITEHLSKELKTVRQEYEAVKRQYRRETEEVMKAYKKNNL